MEFRVGDRVRFKTGTFSGFEGKVVFADEERGRVTVLLTVEGRNTPVDVRCEEIEAA